MNFTLVRTEKSAEGIFGYLKCVPDLGKIVTLEHAYAKRDLATWNVSYEPKLPDGVYTCQRGEHKIPSGYDIHTFEVMGVPDHSGILFHPGNFNDDSEGCILLGEKQSVINGKRAITFSIFAFDRFMDIQARIDSFQLTVISSIE